MNNTPLGIIAGSGDLPLEIARAANESSRQFAVAFVGAQGDGKNYDFEHKFFPLGHVGAVIKYFKDHDIQDIVFAGKIERPNLSSITADKKGRALLSHILVQRFKGDNALLEVVHDFFISNGFRILSPSELISASAHQNFNDKFKLSSQDRQGIEYGVRVLGRVSDLDIGQAVIVEDGYVIGIEAAEGTDSLIRRCALLKKQQNKPSGILVKMMKKNQLRSMDPPCIGVDTINNLAAGRYRGCVFCADTILINSSACFEAAKKNNLFLYRIK